MSRQSSSFLEQKRWAANRIAPRVTGPVITCPVCKGDETVNCLTCQNARIIEASRVCEGCGQFKSYCQCRRQPAAVTLRRAHTRRRGK